MSELTSRLRRFSEQLIVRLRMFLWVATCAAALDGIDISGHQAALDVRTVKADFVIIKATEGKTYVNPSWARHAEQARQSGKRIGFYHFARPDSGNDAITEAEHFLSVVRPYIKRAILALDWERSVSQVSWAKRWLDYVQTQTGVKPFIYMSMSVVKDHPWRDVANAGYPLWVARWGKNEAAKAYKLKGRPRPEIRYWRSYAMWQWTSRGRVDGYGGDLDFDEFQGNGEAWDQYAGQQ